MKFWEAMRALEEGRRVRCKTWPKNSILFKSALGESCWVAPFHGYEFTRDIDEEWELYEEEKKKLKFWMAMKELEEGKTVTPCSYPLPINRKSLLEDTEVAALTYWDEEWELYEEPVQLLSFAEVVKGLKEGKKFRRKNWHRDIYLCLDIIRGHVILENGGSDNLLPEDYEATDWIEVN